MKAGFMSTAISLAIPHDTTVAPSFAIRSFLHEGANSVAVVAQSKTGMGGLTKGASLVCEWKSPFRHSGSAGLSTVSPK